jgi:phosphate transport system substrate-binding protein
MSKRSSDQKFGPATSISRLISLLLSALAFLIVLSSSAAAAEPLLIKGDGSSFAYPMYSKWIEEYEKANPGVHLTYTSNGSGAGIHDVMLGEVDFAGTDGPLTRTQMLDFSTHRNCEVLHFPTALGADVPIYNIPGVTQDLRFTPDALAGIFLGKIKRWNAPEIAQANPGVQLPSNNIVVVHRKDGSGTTYVWSDYLSKVSSAWNDRVGAGIAVLWPVGIAASGNEGLVELVGRTPYSIGYTELTYAVQKHVPYGSVENSSGNFIKADLASVTAAASAMSQMPEDFRVSITNAPGPNSYPISTFTWMLIPSVIADSSKRDAIVAFLQWGLTTGQGFLDGLSYARLPDAVVAKEESAVSRIEASASRMAARR